MASSRGATRKNPVPAAATAGAKGKIKFARFMFYSECGFVCYSTTIDCGSDRYQVTARVGDAPAIFHRIDHETNTRIQTAAIKASVKAWARLLLSDLGGPRPWRAEG
jgi:hypothetical protein